MRSKLYLFLFSVGCLLLIFELLSYIALYQLVDRGVVYLREPVTEERYAKYLEQRNPITGWPAASDLKGRRPDGARKSAFAAENVASPCIAVYGDSFAWGDELSAEQAWPEQLSLELDCPVLNFGVGGFGTDQAYLRFLHNSDIDVAIALLTVTSENLIRNVNVYRDLIYPGGGLGFKPRFVLSNGTGGRLEPLPLVEADYDEYLRMVQDPAKMLEAEYFAPGGSSGVQPFAFPYSLRLISAFTHFHVWSTIQNVPRYIDFFALDHESHALPVTTGILKAFADEAQQRGVTPIVVLLPLCDELEYFERTGLRSSDALRTTLEQQSIAVIDLFPVFWQQRYRELFHACNRHYNAAGARLIARTLAGNLWKSVSDAAKDS